MKKLRCFLTKIYYKFAHDEILEKVSRIRFTETDHESLIKNKEEKIEYLLKDILKDIPYYNSFDYEAHLSALENLKKIQPLQKGNLVNDFESLKTKNKKKLRSSFINHSGGSSGVPTKFLYDGNFMNSFSAWKIYSDSFIKKFPYRILRLWGDQNIALRKKGFKSDVRNYINNLYQVDGFNINESNSKKFIAYLDKYKPDIVECYADAIYNMVLLLKKLNLKPEYKNFAIITSAGTLYPFMRKAIEDFFDVKVYNRYGSREVGPIAMECEQGKIHLNESNLHVEILNDQLKECKLGETGKVYVSTLDNYAMPLIRYNQGDMVTLSQNEFCACGRKSRILETVDGRDTTFIYSNENGRISSLFFVHFFGVVYNNGSIENFQIIQPDRNSILIKAVILNHKKFIEVQDKLEKSLSDVLGSNIQINWEFVNTIEKLPSGKYQYVINNIK